jgi:hypothetical protein
MNSLCKSIVVPYEDTNAKVTNFFPFRTIGISMYQKRILAYFIIPSTSTFSPHASSPLSHHRQTEGRTTFFTPCYLSSFFFHWACGALPAGATLLGWPNYGVDGRLNETKGLIICSPKIMIMQQLWEWWKQCFLRFLVRGIWPKQANTILSTIF